MKTINTIRYSAFAIVILFAGNVSAKRKVDKDLTKSLEKQASFTENKGQITDQNYESRQDVLFSGEANGLVFHLRNDGVSYQLYEFSAKNEERRTNHSFAGNWGIGESGN